MRNAGVFWTCLSAALLLVLVGVEAQTICGRYVCQENEYCYSPYPGYNTCYPFRNYGQSCYKKGIYLCGPGLECVVPFGTLGTCRFPATTSAGTTSADTTTAATTTTVDPNARR